MKRKAILIASGGADPEYPLPGTQRDLQIYKNFLISEEGGAWEDEEIVTLLDADPILIRSYLRPSTKVDYAFVVFSGHGEHVSGGDIDETRVLICNDSLWPVSNLRPFADRYTIILDACRQLREIKEDVTKFAAANERMLLESPQRPYYRRAFDQAVEACVEGGIEIYSCSVNQSSFDTSRGGAFTRSFVKEAREWATSGYATRYSVLSARDAMIMARGSLRAANILQEPVCELGRRRDCFPLAVHL